MQIDVQINQQKIVGKITNPKAGTFISREWLRLITPYTPRENGFLGRNVEVLPFKLHYHEPYAHYQYEGVKYVDPKFGVSGFFNPKWGWFSRNGVTKIPTDEPLNYRKVNPYSTDHWDVKAANAGQINKLYQTINNGLQKGLL